MSNENNKKIYKHNLLGSILKTNDHKTYLANLQYCLFLPYESSVLLDHFLLLNQVPQLLLGAPLKKKI